MFCEKYSCKLSETACFVRRKNALSTSMRDIYKPGYADTGCANCDQGAAVMEKVNPKEAAKYSKSLNKIRHDALWEKAREKKPKKKPTKTKHVFKPIPKPEPKKEKPVSRIKRKRVNDRRVEFGAKNKGLMDNIERYAEEDFRSFAGQIIFILSEYSKQRETEAQP